MDLSNYSIAELVDIYSQSIKELKKRGVLRTKNVVGELGEYLVLEQYDKNPDLPSLHVVPVGTKNINAVSQAGERYSIKSTTGNVTGVIYGLEPPGSEMVDKQLFEYIVICKLDGDCGLEGIYQLSWDGFLKHKRWHSRMNAWNIAITKAMKEDAVVVFENSAIIKNHETVVLNNFMQFEPEEESSIESTKVIAWNKTTRVNHVAVRIAVAERLQKVLRCDLIKTSQSRYVSSDNRIAVFVLSASYSQKNGEYWYSINDENIPWMELFPECYVAFALGSSEQVLIFPFSISLSIVKRLLENKRRLRKKEKSALSFCIFN